MAALVLALLCPGVAAAGSRSGLPPTDIAKVDEFIDAPRALFGKSREQIEGRLGRPLEGSERLHELRYPGVVIAVTAGGLLRSVTITAGDRTLPFGLSAGVPRSEVERVLGEPQALSDVRYMYLYADGYPDTVEFFFRDGRVHRIEWTYATE